MVTNNIIIVGFKKVYINIENQLCTQMLKTKTSMRTNFMQRRANERTNGIGIRNRDVIRTRWPL